MNPENRPTSRDRSSMSLGVILALAVAGPAQHQHGQAVGSNGFQTMIGDAVARMHVEMDVPFSGDADTDFARRLHDQPRAPRSSTQSARSGSSSRARVHRRRAIW